MRNSRTMAVAALALPLLGTSLIGVGAAQADSSTQTLIQELGGTYRGAKSSAGKAPRIKIETGTVARAFVDKTSVYTARKVAKATDGKAEKKGDKVRVEGFRCKATSFKIKNPGTAGEYNVVGWRCTFQDGDTDTVINLQYKQASL